MLKTLRRRFIFSHVLPLLVIIPLVGIALIYVLETQILLPNLAEGLAEDAVLIANVLSRETEIWSSPARAQAVLTRLGPGVPTRVMLLDAGGRLLASSDPLDAERLSQRLKHHDLAQILTGEASVHIDYSQDLHTEIADVLMPVVGPDRQILGIVRLSHQLIDVHQWFQRLRYLIGGVLAGGLLLGAAVGLVLAIALERPLGQITQAIYQLASDQGLKSLPEQGPKEICLLSHAVNILAERRRSVEQMNRQLLANLVHELGRPLGAFYSAIHALQQGADKDLTIRQELLAGMAGEVRRFKRLLDDLSRLYDRTIGRLELECQPIVLNQWLPQVLSSWREAAADKGLQWQATIPDDLPILEADPDRLGQALGNLLSNAIKYTPSGGTVSIEAGFGDSAIWIRVSDTGPGIAPEDQAHIFTPFYRTRETNHFKEGMGLGLSIAYDLIVAHKGRLEVESRPGLGSRFTLFAPITLS